VSDLKLFRIDGTTARELSGSQAPLEKSLQALIEKNLETFFGVRLLASEYVTSKKHGGRMDSLGIDENGSPVIFEYKRASNENVINQGLFYLDWLMDHRADFHLLVQQQLGQSAAQKIDWSNPRLVCVAGDFNRYDEHAVAQINRSIELFRYRHYETGLLALELVATTDATVEPGPVVNPSPAKTVAQYHQQASSALRDLYSAVETFLMGLGDDVIKKETQQYYAFRRIKNFACIEVHPQTQNLLMFVKVNPDSVELEAGFTRDVRKIGHFGTGDLEIRMSSLEQMPKVEPLFVASYEAS
jgi:predicted transport protein